MKVRWMIGMCCVVLLAMATLRAEDKPAAEKTEKKSAGKLTMPWKQLTDLSDEQKSKLTEIHSKANAEVKAIRDKEIADSTEVLNDAQKAELKTLMEKDSASKKMKKTDAPATDEKK